MNTFTKNELNTLLNNFKNGKFSYIKDFSENFPYNPTDASVTFEKINNGILIDLIMFSFKTKYNVIETISIHKTTKGYFVSLDSEEYLMYNKNSDLDGLSKSASEIEEVLNIVNVFSNLINL